MNLILGTPRFLSIQMLDFTRKIWRSAWLACSLLLAGVFMQVGWAQTPVDQEIDLVSWTQILASPGTPSRRATAGNGQEKVGWQPLWHQVHGSTDGSKLNRSANHPVSRLFDSLSAWGGKGSHIYGYVDQGFTWNPASPANRTNGLVMNNYRANDYQFNAIYFEFSVNFF